MTRKVSNFTDLIQRVTTSCLLHPLAPQPQTKEGEDEEEECHSDSEGNKHEEDMDEVEEEEEEDVKKLKLMEALMEEMFEGISRMKRAYVSLQEAHCPWEPEKMRVADVAVVAELKKLGVFWERFRRRSLDGGKGTTRRRGRSGGGGLVAASLRQVVAPYEAVIEELKKQLKAKDLEVQNLKEKLDGVVTLACSNGCGEKKSERPQPRRKLGFSQIQAVPAAPSPQLLEAAMFQVREASKSLTSLLLKLMHNAHWDIPAAVHSIEAATATTIENNKHITTTSPSTMVSIHHAKYALESYISRKIFQGFDHETFYMDGSLSSLLNPDQFRRDCFTQYRDMKFMDPADLLGISPTCNFGRFCSNKYLAIVHPKMEQSLFGNLEQHSEVSAGKSHPRTKFYNEFLRVAKTVWLLHLVAFSLDPAPSQFEASRGAEFHPQYMESVVKFSGGKVPTGQVVGFPVSPGFKLESGSVIKARVYLMGT